MLIFVQSTPSNYKQRAVIRETWANRTNSKSLQDSRARVLFMIGNGEVYSAEIQREISKYDDIILYDFEDTYRNLVYKTAATLLFSKNCFSSFTMKIDEDVAVHIDKLADKTLAHVSPDEAALLCKTLPLERARRDPQSAWYISKYRLAEDALPTYCSGPSYIMTRKALELIIETAPKFRLISVEDIFFTGVIAKSAGVKLVEQRPTYLQTPHKECSPNIISNHNLKTPEEMRSTWKLLQSRC
ncbi:hypothetical protein PRIPAC_73126 [Pristionchus pacificus]|uniref:Hexosyltransferase n=1 Tax=Pristionchus pacificus TaxID=54126 RepID=A0A2A6CG27_PRIPA|nr:hypothetical protein PRIPAC_73126 [Pristionchus pacificus]|eukprot:PDM77040.1 hypothetical protein PRIPAC_42435 [Pristionchus pacificus]